MADLYAVAQTYSNAGAAQATLGSNARTATIFYPGTAEAAANPYSQFGTRKLTFKKITAATGVGTNPENANSVFFRATQALQEVSELFYIEAVAANTLIVGIAEDTDNGAGVGNTDNDKTLKEALDAVDGITSVTVATSGVFQTS
jgi:hypothetical protein